MAERMKGRFTLGSSVDGSGEGVDTVGPRTGFKDISHGQEEFGVVACVAAWLRGCQRG